MRGARRIRGKDGARVVKKESDTGPGKIICPACRSEVASDGSKLFSKSKRLADLEEAADVSGQVEAEISKLEKEIADLRDENKKLKAVKAAPAREDPDAELRG